MSIMTGYRTYMAVAGTIVTQGVALLQAFNVIPQGTVDPELLNMITVALAIAACWFNKVGRDKIKKAVKK